MPIRSAMYGAYGIQLEGVDDAADFLVPAADAWPRLRVERRRGALPPFVESVDEEVARLRLRDGGGIVIERQDATATFTVPRIAGAAEIVHPLLAPAAAVVAHWEGRESFHAGGIVIDGRGWGIVGPRGSGKSTTMAALAATGIGVLCDDLLVVEAGVAMAGPRSVDLRESPIGALGDAEALGIVGARPRWRVRLGAVEPRVELAGWIFLAWGDVVECVAIPPRQRLQRLHAERALRVSPRDPAALVGLASLPSWELRRPKDLRALPASTQLLVGTAA
jgi:hypothetical protein